MKTSKYARIATIAMLNIGCMAGAGVAMGQQVEIVVKQEPVTYQTVLPANARLVTVNNAKNEFFILGQPIPAAKKAPQSTAVVAANQERPAVKFQDRIKLAFDDTVAAEVGDAPLAHPSFFVKSAVKTASAKPTVKSAAKLAKAKPAAKVIVKVASAKSASAKPAKAKHLAKAKAAVKVASAKPARKPVAHVANAKVVKPAAKAASVKLAVKTSAKAAHAKLAAKSPAKSAVKLARAKPAAKSATIQLASKPAAKPLAIETKDTLTGNAAEAGDMYADAGMDKNSLSKTGLGEHYKNVTVVM